MPSALREFAGRLNQPIQLQVASETTGDGVPSFTPVVMLWGELTALGGNQQSGIVATGSYEIRTHWRPDLMVGVRKMRLALLGTNRVFDITGAIDPDGRQRELRILATEILT